jgi:hypothetical protein
MHPPDLTQRGDAPPPPPSNNNNKYRRITDYQMDVHQQQQHKLFGKLGRS